MNDEKRLSSADFKDALKRVKASDLDSNDKALISDLLKQHIKLAQVLERSTTTHGDRTVIAKLPLGFDLVK